MKNYDEKKLEQLLSLTWHGDKKMIDHCTKSTAYLSIDDMIVGVCDAKPSIVKTIWYDDEQEDPGTGFDIFVNANRHNIPTELELNRTRSGRRSNLCYIVAYWNDKTDGKLVSLAHKDDDELGDEIRKVTAEELELINEVIREQRENYTKRLERYFKQHNKSIHSCGYWVNR